MRCDPGFGGETWDQYAPVADGVGYGIAGWSAMVQQLGASFAAK